jgi:hypothetical protein
MEMELVSRETIKPSSPTPSHHRIYPLSFLDNIAVRKYIPLLYFYNQTKDNDQISKFHNFENLYLNFYLNTTLLLEDWKIK